MPESEPQRSNRLINEKSPYLLQHAHNPVDWFPWGDEAFLKAKDEDKPIFLSIGYATCHWCHVMEKESFENPVVAGLMNDSFINIKVDREELPEVDSLYMEFAQAIMPGGGGWPLNVLLTPELHPFFATTYIPPTSGHGYIGFNELIQRLSELWKDPEEKEKLIEQAGRILEVFVSQTHAVGEEIPPKDEIAQAADLLFQMADPIYGGIKGEPKFPMGYHICFLLSYAKTFNDSRALFCVELTLDMMQRGGIWDHLGGGFSRYSVDSRWLIPHFEKMLYDNAILARAYLEAWAYTKKPLYKEIAQDTLKYILRDMTSEEGGFYSAEDADSEGKEGYFYTWTPDEVIKVLGSVDAPIILDYYGITNEGNFEGRSILHIRQRLEEFAEKRNLDPEKLQEILENSKEKMRVAREKREHPFKDDKILSSWNGLMIYSLVAASRAFGRDDYLLEALKAAQFIEENFMKDDHLFRRYRQGDVRFAAGLDEYAFLIHGVLSLFEESSDTKWLKFALNLTEILENEFKAEDGAYYLTDGKDPNIVLRRCEFYDGAEPSGNGIHCENLLRLHQITFDEKYLTFAEDVLRAAKKHIEHHPVGCCYSLMALQRFYDRHAKTIVIALNESEAHKEELRALLKENYLPHDVIIWRHTDNYYSERLEPSLIELVPHLKDKIAIDGKTTLYICQKGECLKPINEWADIEKTFTCI